MQNGWNPWHGCTKISAGCKNCYVYRQDGMYGCMEASSLCRKTASFDLPLRKKRNGEYAIPPSSLVMTCFTSDFLLPDADEWRPQCWAMMRERRDCMFYFFTKRIDRLAECLPDDWGDGYENVMIGCTVENQERADVRLKIFKELPIKHKTVIAAPLLERIDISSYLDDSIEEVSAGGESGPDARACDYDWILFLAEQCGDKNVPFTFHQTGANFIVNGKTYRVKRKYQHMQAKKAGIDFGKHEYEIPDIESGEEQLKIDF